MPPMVGFLAAGFLLNSQGIAGDETLRKLADLGITLLLFTVGLKMNMRFQFETELRIALNQELQPLSILQGTVLH